MTWGHEDANLVRLHDGLLDEAAAQRVRGHLGQCSRCRELDVAIRFSRGALQSLSPVAVHETDREKARAAMLQAAAEPAHTREASWRWAIAGVAAIVILGAIAWWYRPHVRFVAGPAQPRSIESVAIAEERLWSVGRGAVTEAISSLEVARRRVESHTGIAPKLRPGERRLIGLTQTAIGSAPASSLIYRIEDQPVVLVVASAARLADPPPSLLSTKRLEMRHDRDARIFTWSAGRDAYSLAVPKSVPVAKACAVCHEGTRMMPLIEASTGRM